MDAGNGIQVNITSRLISAMEEKMSNIRYILGYISGEFKDLDTTADLYVKIYFQRGIEMDWESVQYKLVSGEKYFRQKLPPGLVAIAFYVELYGWITGSFELTALKLSVKELSLGKYAGEELVPETTTMPPPVPVIPTFSIYIPIIGEVDASSATAVWYTTHAADTKVKYGISPNNLINEVADGTFDNYHEIILSNLVIGQLYYAKFYSVSQITGEEISSEMFSFRTGYELTVEEIIDNSTAAFSTLSRQLISLSPNTLGETESTQTTQPDGENESVSILSTMNTHSKVELSAFNTIGGEYTTEVTP